MLYIFQIECNRPNSLELRRPCLSQLLSSHDIKSEPSIVNRGTSPVRSIERLGRLLKATFSVIIRTQDLYE
jgi:hypothetical protein